MWKSSTVFTGVSVRERAVRELLEGTKIDMPQTRGVNVTSKQAPKAAVAAGGPGQLSLMDDDED